jgi:hypothetical protein
LGDEHGLELAALEVKLKAAKESLAKIYERKGKTDLEVLAAGTEVDRLLNEYEALLKKKETKVMLG